MDSDARLPIDPRDHARATKLDCEPQKDDGMTQHAPEQHAPGEILPAAGSGMVASVQHVETVARRRGDVLLHGEHLSRDELAHTASELAQLADYLSQISAERSQFLGKVSHELRTPLTIAKGWMSMLRDYMQAPEQERIVGVIDQQIDELTRLVNDLLDLSRRDVDALALHLEKVDLVALVNQVAEHQREVTILNGVRLHVRTHEPVVHACADRGRIAQVLNNLISNACRYVPHFGTGWIELKVELTDTAACITVRDNGIGIAPEYLPRIFEPFFQVQGHKRGKSGLGLTIAQELVLAHGGSLTVESTLGKGTSFHIWLRRMDANEAHGAQVGYRHE